MTAGMTAGVPQADGALRPEPQMDVADVARAVVYMASLPLDCQRRDAHRDGHQDAVRRSRLSRRR